MLACPFLGPRVPSSPGFRFPLRPAAVTGARVTRAFNRALEYDGPSVLAELRAAPVAFAATAKAEGRSSDEVLVALKRVIERNGWWPTLRPCRRGTGARIPPFACVTPQE